MAAAATTTATTTATTASSELARTSTAKSKTVQPKRRKQATREDVPLSGHIFACVLGEEINIEKIDSDWHKFKDGASSVSDAMAQVHCAITMAKEVLYLTIFNDLEVFVFDFGVIVTCGMDLRQFEETQLLLREYVKQPNAINHEPDLMSYHYNVPSANELQQGISATKQAADRPTSPIITANTSIQNDLITLTSTHIFEKLSYAYAFGQSVKLDVFEAEVLQSINDTTDIPEKLASSGSEHISSKVVTVKMGELFVHRCNVNLHSDILGTPSIFWDFDEFEILYSKCREYLDIDKRISVLNSRLDIMKEMYSILQQELNVQHGNKLEWIVIVLISAEIFLQLIGLVVSLYTGGSHQ
jgi:uncharacterized Rmd1/YagE family protein